MLTIVQHGSGLRGKPPEVVRGFSSRLPWVWDGLCFAVPFNDATQDAARDLVVNVPPTTVAGLSWARDNRGNPVASLGTSSNLGYPDNPAHNKPSTAITIHVRLRRVGTPDTSGGIFCKSFAAEPTGWESWNIQCNSSQPLLTSIVFNNPTNYVQLPTSPEETYTLPTTTWVSVFVRWITGGPVRLDVLGERGETLYWNYSTAYSGDISYGANVDPIRINATNNIANNYNAEYSQAMLWSRQLTDTELQALVSDPYGWYSPRRSTVLTSSPYALPFGGGEMQGSGGWGGLY